LTGEAKRYATLPGGHSLGWADALKSAVNSFYESILCGSFTQDLTGYATFNDGHYIMKLVEACLLSSRTKAWVDIVQ